MTTRGGPTHWSVIAHQLLTNLQPDREQPMTTETATNPGGPWTSHGHTIPGITVDGPGRPDLVARCGGPSICATCASEAARIREGHTR